MAGTHTERPSGELSQGGDLDGGEWAQDGFDARQEGEGFIEGNSAVEVD